MSSKSSRREFIAGLTAVAGSWAIPPAAFSSLEPLYPPMDLSHFDTPISAAPAEIKIGYAAITWGGNDQRAIEDIAALGFSGIQLRSNLLGEFPNPADVRNLLGQHHLTMVALSSGGVRVEVSDEASEIDKHVKNAKYTHAAGGLYLQVTDQKPKGSLVNPYKKLGRLLVELGRGRVDLPAVFQALHHVRFRGWAVVELDSVPDPSRSPRESALVSKNYLHDRLGISI